MRFNPTLNISDLTPASLGTAVALSATLGALVALAKAMRQEKTGRKTGATAQLRRHKAFKLVTARKEPHEIAGAPNEPRLLAEGPTLETAA